jgi:hypothetical protein
MIMPKQEFDELLSETGVPCISIIVPTHRLSPDRIQDPETLSKEVERVKELLNLQYPQSDHTNDMVEKMDELISKIDFVHSKDGIGIFVSPRISKLVPFSFPVRKKIKAGDAFDSRDLIYNRNTIIDYCVLSISKKNIQLFKAKGEDIQEINNGDFPLHYEETYEYSKPSRATSFEGSGVLKGFERDKSVLEDIRLKDFLRTADHLLEKYLNTNTPLVVAGGTKEIADYLEITQFEKRIIAEVKGNYNFNGDKQLAGLAWKEVQNHFKDQNEILVSNLQELVGKGMIAIGIEKVWKAAREGKGLQLIVEKDFECNAFLLDDQYELKLKKPTASKKYITINDSVERVIKTVREKGGKIVFVDNGELKNFKGIALQLRYSSLS